jgi:uncharacterized protein YjeT (DUF2065 family)|nr:DUF2065 domain-containing protein [Oceanococcus sp. HetDA_MAG_MS8]
MTEAFLQAVALAMVIEGMGPFLLPGRWRRMMLRLLQLPENNLRVFGALTMGMGVLILQLTGS